MSFGREMKDFAEGLRSGAQLRYEQARTDYYEGRADGADPNKKYGDYDVMGAYSADDASGDSNHKPAKHSALHNIGHALGLNQDERDTGYTPTQAVSTASSPTAISSAVSNAPTAAYAGANSGVPEYNLAPGTDEDPGYYARGGLVRPRGYAEGGVVAPGSDDQDDEADSPPPPQQAVPAQPAPAAGPSGPQSSPSPPPQQEDSGQHPDMVLEAANHAGLMKLQEHFGLNQQSAVPTPDKANGQKAMMSGEGAPSKQEMDDVLQNIDPHGQMGDAMRWTRAMVGGYNYYMKRGEPDRAANYAAMVIQYTSGEAAKYGQIAAQQLKDGDVHAAAQSLEKGYNSIPDGKSAENVKVNPDNTVSVTQTDLKTGKPVGQHTLTGAQLLNAALGLSNKSSYYQTIMQAASAAKGYAPPESDAYTNAMLKLGGVNPDGTLAQPTQATPAQTPEQGQTAAPQGYMQMMAQRESGNKPDAANGSSVGLYQFTPDQWETATGQKIPPQVIGTPQDPRLNPQLSSAAMEKSTQLNASQFQKTFNRAPTPGELAIMHQQGLNGGIHLINAANNAPNASAVQVLHAAGVDPQRAAQSLQANGIPPNATAKQAVQMIQNYYLTGNRQAGPSTPRPGGAMALQPALPEDQPEQPDLPDKPAMPQTPQQIAVDPQAMSGMTPAERKQYIASVAKVNLQNQKEFQDKMAQYRAQAADYAKASKQPKAGKDAFSLPVKDRGDALKVLQASRQAIDDDTTGMSPLKDLSPYGKRAANSVAYGIYAHNDVDPDTAYQMTGSLMNPKSMNFTAHEMPGGNVRIVFKTGQKIAMPQDAYDALAVARGNELHIQRKTREAAAVKAASDAKIAAERKKAAGAAVNIAAKIFPAPSVDSSQTGGIPLTP